LVRWSVAAPVAVLEDATFSVAFARSKRLVKGAWWRSFATLLLMVLAAVLVAWGISAAADGIVQLADADTGAAQALSNFVTSLVTSPPLDCLLFALYAALRDRERSRGEQGDS
jgi:hypothetical protein